MMFSHRIVRSSSRHSSRLFSSLLLKQPSKPHFSLSQQMTPTFLRGLASVAATPDVEMAKIVRKVKADLVEADINKDGRIDSEELKLILKKYPGVFKDQDITEIGELIKFRLHALIVLHMI